MSGGSVLQASEHAALQHAIPFGLFKFEFLSSWRRRADFITPAVFYLIVVTLFPLSVEPNSSHLQQYGPGIIWIAALLAMILNVTQLFAREYSSGELDQLQLSPHSLSLLLSIKILCAWAQNLIPIIVITPVMAVFLHLTPTSTEVLLASLLLGTPSLFLLGAIGSILTLSIKQNSLLLAILILPIFIPILVFATGSVRACQAGLPYSGLLALLGSILILCLLLAPWSCASALKLIQANAA